MAALTRRRTKTNFQSMLVRGRTTVRGRAAATRSMLARTIARARVVARPMDRNHQRMINPRVINPSRSRTNALQPQWVGVECPGPLFLGKMTCQQILSTDSPILELG